MSKRRRNRTVNISNTIDQLDNKVDDIEVEEEETLVESESVVEEPVPVAQEVETVNIPTNSPKQSKYNLEAIIEELDGILPKRALDEWTLRALMDYKDHGIQVELSKRNNYKYSRKRPVKVSEWSVDELMDWMEGNVVPHRSTREEDLWDEIYLRWKIPSDYTEEATKEFIFNNVVPEATDKGILIEDRRRNKSSLLDLTYPELCSIYLDEVPSTFSKTEVKDRLKTITRTISEEQFEKVINRFKEGNKNMTTLTDQMIGVLEARKELYIKYGDRVTDDKLANNTKAIYNNLRRVMKADYAEFSEAWRSLLKYVDNNYNLMFNPSQIRRGWFMVELSQANVAVLDRLLTLIVGTRNAATRRNDVKMFNMDHILELILNSKERENMIGFYQE